MSTPATLAEDRQTLLTVDGAGKTAKAAALARLESAAVSTATPACVVSPRVPALAARLMQLAVTFGAGQFEPKESGWEVPVGPSLFVRFDAHVASLDVQYHAQGWKRHEVHGDDGKTWSRSVYLDRDTSAEELEAIVREVEAVFGITPSFALFPPVS